VPDVKGVIAVLVIIGDFGLVAPYVIRNEVPDSLVLAFVTGSLMLILGFYFGHLGTQTALANSAVTLATQAQTMLTLAAQRRVSDPTQVQVVPVPPTIPAAPVSPTAGSGSLSPSGG
jgi:hypothetical protein